MVKPGDKYIRRLRGVKYSHIFVIKLNDELFNRLTEVTNDTGYSRTYIVDEAIRNWLEKTEKNKKLFLQRLNKPSGSEL